MYSFHSEGVFCITSIFPVLSTTMIIVGKKRQCLKITYCSSLPGNLAVVGFLR